MPRAPHDVNRGGLIDPRRHGDHRVYVPPTRHHDGRVVTERPWTNPRGRYIPPSRDHITIINHNTIINNMNGIHRGWDTRDHGYRWHHWNGHQVRHHYDVHGYHWWDFYIGGGCYRTRYHSGRHWWYDPYWHRWVYLHDNRWWWQDPAAPAVVYVIIDNNYYRYQENGGTVIIKPDTTPPVDAPPAEPNASAPDQETMFSLDGTRSVQILTDKKEAYLYDLTGTDPNGAAAGGQWLASGVKSAKFVYDDKHEADGTTTQVIRQIELDFDDAAMAAIADPEGERKIVITGAERSAYLYDLKDEAKPSAYLADGVSEIKLVNADGALKLVIVTARESGVDSLLMFDRDGQPYRAAAPKTLETGSSPAERLRKSAAFNVLQSDKVVW